MQLRRFLLPCVALVALALSAAAAPDEEQLGRTAGYPIGSRASWFFDESVRVGSFSNLDRILPHYTLAKATSPLPLSKAASEPKIEYRFEQQTYTIDDFLARQRVTGLLLIKDGEILVGTTTGYRPGRPGFFLVPADTESNIERCYVVATATEEISFL